MRLFGSVTYEWRGAVKHAVAAPNTPDVRIRLEDRWVAVSRLGGGTELVAWDAIKELRAWAPVAPEDR